MIHLSKAVITAAGLGTRLLPSSKEIPKEMFPIFDLDESGSICVKPVMHRIFENLYDIGFKNFCIIVGRGKRSIEDHFTPDRAFSILARDKVKPNMHNTLTGFYQKILDSKIFFINQPEPKGFGDAVLRAETFVGDEHFLLHAGDDLVLSEGHGHLLRLLEVFKKYGGDMTILAERVENPSQYGVIVGEPLSDDRYLMRVRDIVEKPAKPPSNIAVIGVYILSPRIFKALRSIEPDERGEIQLTSALRRLLEEGGEGYAVLLREDEKRLDVGNPVNYYRALVESYNFCLKRIKRS